MTEARARWRLSAMVVLALGACAGRIEKGVPLKVDGGDDAGPAGDGGGVGLTPIGSVGRDAGRTTTIADDGLSDDDGPDAGSDEGESGATGERDFSTDSAAFLGTPRCERLGARLCDDFESEGVGGRPDPSLWSAPYGYFPQIDNTRAARGQKSLHFRLSGSTPGHIEQSRTFPASGNTVFGRLFIWFDVLPASPSSAQWSVVTATSMDEQWEVRIGGQPLNENRFGIGSRRAGDGGWDWHTPGSDAQSRPKTGAWTCLEWQFKGDTNETRVWIDGVEQGSLHLTATEFRRGDREQGQRFEQPTYARLRLGWWLYPTESPQPSEYDVWIDEVAVDGQRIGCAN